MPGYPDDQRVQDWQDAPVIGGDFAAAAVPDDYARFECDRWHGVQVHFENTFGGNPMLIQVRWLTAQTGGILLAVRDVTVGVGAVARFFLPHEGPWCTFRIWTSAIGQQYRLWVLNTNRLLQPFSVPGSDPLIDLDHVNVAGGATRTDESVWCYSGLAHVAFDTAAVNHELRLEGLDYLGVVRRIWDFRAEDAVAIRATVYVPPLRLRSVFVNQDAGVASVRLHVTPAYFGGE